jgi:hypothetical protein
MSMRRHAEQRGASRAGLLTLLLTTALVVTVALCSPAWGRARARISRTLNGTATARLHLVKPEGAQLIEEGPVSGALSGSAWAKIHTGAIFTAIFTIHTQGGSITGEGRANPHGSGRYQSFSGTFVVKSGSGRYVHVNGQAGLYGVFDRRRDAVVIQTTGRFTY